MLNSASRSRSAVGRIACDFGASSVPRPTLPQTLRISGPAGLCADGRGLTLCWNGAASACHRRVVSPPPARAARGGEGSGVGGLSNRKRAAPTPPPTAPPRPPPPTRPPPPAPGGEGKSLPPPHRRGEVRARRRGNPRAELLAQR